MKRYLSLLSLMTVIDAAYATGTETNFDYGVYSGVTSFDTRDIFVSQNVTVNAEPGNDIIVNHAPVYLYNNGIINGRINTNGENLFLYNTGEITGGITALIDGTVTQRIRSASEMTYVDIDAINYVVEISNYNGLKLVDIKDIDANSFKIRDTVILVDTLNDWQNWYANSNVELEGNISLKVSKNTTASGEKDIVTTSSSASNVNISIQDSDNLYKTELESNGSGLFVKIIRETDFNKIYNNNLEWDPLEIIRQRNPNDKLVVALDSADNINQINQLKNASYRYNHAILLKPIKTINNFSLMNNIMDKNGLGIGLSTDYTVSDSLNDIGGRLFYKMNYNNLYVDMGFTLNKFSYSDNLNDFSGMAYGLDVKAKQNFDNIWVYTVLGSTLANYQADYISNNKELKENPFGKSFYGSLDFGHDIKFVNSLTLSPFMGAVYQNYKVVDVSCSGADIRGGANVKYSFISDDIEYEYLLSGSLDDNTDLFAKFQFGFMALTDMAGATFGVDLYKNEEDTYYKLSLNAKIMF